MWYSIACMMLYSILYRLYCMCRNVVCVLKYRIIQHTYLSIPFTLLYTYSALYWRLYIYLYIVPIAQAFPINPFAPSMYVYYTQIFLLYYTARNTVWIAVCACVWLYILLHAHSYTTHSVLTHILYTHTLILMYVYTHICIQYVIPRRSDRLRLLIILIKSLSWRINRKQIYTWLLCI